MKKLPLMLALAMPLAGHAQSPLLLQYMTKKPVVPAAQMDSAQAIAFFRGFDQCKFDQALDSALFEAAGVKFISSGRAKPAFAGTLFNDSDLVFEANKKGATTILVPTEDGEDAKESYVFTNRSGRYINYEAHYPKLALPVRFPTGEMIQGLVLKVGVKPNNPKEAISAIQDPRGTQIVSMEIYFDRYRGERFIERMSLANGGYAIKNFDARGEAKTIVLDLYDSAGQLVGAKCTRFLP